MRFAPVLALVAFVAACGGGGDGGGTTPTPVPESITIAPPAPDSLFSGGATLQLNATVRDEDDQIMNNQAVTWSTSNAAVATVNAGTGLVTAVAVGNVAQSATITATVNGHPTVTSSVSVRVRQKVASVDLTPDPVNLNVSATQQLTVAARDARGVGIAGITGYTYGSANDAIASVSATGLVTAGAGAGTTKIGVTITKDGATRTDSVTVNVATAGSTADVATNGFSFVPETVNLTRAGAGPTATVNWALGATHNVTWDAAAPPDGNIPTCAAGTCAVSRNFNTAGTFNYHCSIHGSPGAGMHGTVVVQ